MGADEIIDKRASVQPNDIEEMEWPLEGVIDEERFLQSKSSTLIFLTEIDGLTLIFS